MTNHATHTDLAVATVRAALERAEAAVGYLDDLLTDDQLSPPMLQTVLRKLNLKRDTLDFDHAYLGAIEEPDPMASTPFLRSVREMRVLLSIAALTEEDMQAIREANATEDPTLRPKGSAT